MTERHSSDERLRQAFQALAASADHECSAGDLDQIRRAVRGELPSSARRALVERLAVDPALAEAWRVANALRRHGHDDPVIELRRPAWTPARWLATAAVALLALSVVLLVSRRDRTDIGTMRDAGGIHIVSLVAEDAALPREAFRLRWSPGPPGSRYQVRATTEDLQVLATIANLTEVAVTIDRTTLAALTAGSRVFWQVEVTLPTGERTTSPTFAARVGGIKN